jgi:hypothetical protein
MAIEKVEETQTNNGRDCILWTLKVLGPKNAGEVHKCWDVLDRPTEKEQKISLSYLKQRLIVLGIRMGKLSELPQFFAQMTGTVVEVRLKTSANGFQNAYFNKLVRAPARNGEATGTGSAQTPPVPSGIRSLSPF